MIDPRLLRDDLDATADRAGAPRLRPCRPRPVASSSGRPPPVLIAEVDDARAEQGRLAADRAGRPEERPAMIEAGAELKDRVARLEAQLAEVEAEHARRSRGSPNLPHPDAPDGRRATGSSCARSATKPTFDFSRATTSTCSSHADAIDLARGAKVSGARFAYLKGEGALLEFALVRYAIDIAMATGTRR
jgi:seryl-tRNA synthetase